MCKFIYKWLTDTKSASYNDYIMDAINAIEKYGLWEDPQKSGKIVSVGDAFDIQGNAYFKREKNGKEVYDLFFDNLHIHVSDFKETVISIRLKRPDEAWSCKYNSDAMSLDFSHPVNDYYEVYVWYVVPVLDITTAKGYIYKHGDWDKYVFNTMIKFFTAIKGETDASRFNGYYHRLPKVREEIKKRAGK